MRQLTDLIQFWQSHTSEALALCTLVHKEGSSYCAPGAKKIISLESGISCGLLSGGCLEGDIEKTAREGSESLPFLKSFSTLSETDRLLGYQTGCAGLITILFERLPPATTDIALYLPYGSQPEGAGIEISLGSCLGRRKKVPQPAVGKDIFFDPWIMPVKLYVIGCGSDALAFDDLARPLGWQTHFIDYRSDHQLAGLNTEILPLGNIASAIAEGPNTAVLLVTHNYEADMEIMAGLYPKSFGYIGCLGPAKRYQQMKEDLQKLRSIAFDPAWERIVYSPAGLLPKQRTPETIALSVISEIQQVLNG